MNEELFEKVEKLQNLLLEYSTGLRDESSEEEYLYLRKELLSHHLIKDKLPDFVQSARNLNQFWHFIKTVSSSYAGRREFLWGNFGPILNYLEQFDETPAQGIITKKIQNIDEGFIKSEWEKAIQRKDADPEGAITTSRTLLETVCKHILDGFEIEYDDKIDLPKLYKLTAQNLNLAPDQHNEKIFKQILNGCQSVVEGLGALRNKLSDSHGKRIGSVKPSTRHAELAVNLAGTMTIFLFETYERNKTLANNE